MKKTNHILFFIAIAFAFAIAGFNFEDLSFEENSKEYVLLAIAVVLAIIYLVNRTVLSKK